MSIETLVKCLRRPEAEKTIEYLDKIQNATLPRRGEVLLEFLLRATKDAQNATNLACLWKSMVGSISYMSQANLILILRKSDFMSSLKSSLTQIHRSPNALKHISNAFHILMRSRRVAKAISYSADVSVSILESLINQKTPHEGLNLLVQDYVNFVLQNTAQKQARKKYIECIKGAHLSRLCAHIPLAESSISRLLRSTFFSEQILLENASNTSAHILQGILSEFSTDMINEDVIGLPYHAINCSNLSSEKKLTSLNQVLSYWLRSVPVGLFLSTLQQYRAQLPSGHRIRVLSHPDNRIDLSRLLEHCFQSGDSRSTLILIILLEIDLDVLIPSNTDRLFALCGPRQELSKDDVQELIDTIQSLEVALYQAFTVLRNSEAFVNTFAALLKTNRGTNVKLIETIASTIGNAHDSVKDRLFSSLIPLAIDTRTRAPELLLALVSGCPLHCCTLSKHANDLKRLAEQASEPNLDIMISVMRLRLEPQQVQPLSDTASADESRLFVLQSILRVLEVNPALAIQSDLPDLLLSELRKQENDVFLLSVLDRWLPLLTSLFDDSQQSQFIKICIEQRHIGHSNLLEIQGFHHEIQSSILNLITSTSDLSVVSQIPIEYYHRAVRHQIVQILIKSDSDNEIIDTLLLKFARSGIFANSVAIERLQTFSARWTGELLALYIESLAFDTIVEQLPASANNLEDTHEVYTLLMKRAKALQRDCEALQSKTKELRRNMLEWSVAASASASIQSIVAALKIFVELSKLDGPEIKLSDTTIGMASEFYCLGNASTDAIMQSSKEDKFLTYIHEFRNHEDKEAQRLALIFLALQSTSAARTHVTLNSLEPARDGQALYDSITKVLPHREQRKFASEYRLSTHSSQYYSLLLAFAKQSGDSSFSFLNGCVESACGDIAQLRLKALAEQIPFMIQVIDRHSSVLATETIDYILVVAPIILRSEAETELSMRLGWMCSVIRALSEHQSLRLQNRYHIIIGIFQAILAALFRVDPAHSSRALTETVTRCFATFLSCMRQNSNSSERTNKALAKHVPWLLVEYIAQATSPRSKVLEASNKRLLEEHICYEIMTLCGMHEREMIGAALDSGKRAVFKRLYDEWNKFGRYNEK